MMSPLDDAMRGAPIVGALGLPAEARRASAILIGLERGPAFAIESPCGHSLSIEAGGVAIASRGAIPAAIGAVEREGVWAAHYMPALAHGAPDHPVLAHLPPLLVLPPGDPTLATFLRAVERERIEAWRSEIVVEGMLAALFVAAVRAWTNSACPWALRSNWLTALADPGIARSLTAIHRAPASPHPIGALAKIAGMSRASFTARFRARVGLPPGRYVALRRATYAAELLRSSVDGLDQIAARAGYADAPTLTRAFRRAYGTTPGAYRRDAEPGPDARGLTPPS